MQPLDVNNFLASFMLQGLSGEKYIKFEFSIGDPELAVEIIRYSQSAHPMEFGTSKSPELERQ